MKTGDVPVGTHDFYSLGIAPKVLDLLDRMKFKTPTPIQSKAIPAGIQGEDIIGVAQTGTGKTLAFGIPALQNTAHGKGKVLVLAPTRELATQIDESLKGIAGIFGTRTALLIGGAPIQGQIKALNRRPRMIIATPGRIIDHIERKSIHLKDVKVLILDEADRMLDMGFAPQIERILKTVPGDRQTMLFSATMPGQIISIAKAHMKFPVHVEVAPSGTVSERVTQELFIVKKEEKNKILKKILDQYQGSVLVFTRTRWGASKAAKAVKAMGYKAAEIHSDRTLGQRRQALEGFKSGAYRILVATDIAARGIDVTGIELVVNYDLPDDSENYIHRIGRTGRAGHEGHAISFATPVQRAEVKKIEEIIKTAIPIAEHPDMPAEKFLKPATVFKSRRSFKKTVRRRR